jgi:glycosyltransferase involved in cell wall biosynthesis
LRRVLHGADLVHVNDHRGLMLAGPAAKLAGVPFVWHTHGVLPPTAVNLLGRLLARRTIVLTAADAGRLPGGRLRPVPDVVPNAPEGDFFDIVRRPTQPPTVVTMARLNAIKGIDVLLEALVIVHRQRAEVTATILGGPQDGYAADAAQLDRLRIDLGLQSAVTFAGHRDRPDEVLAAASVYVQPSRWEGVPMAVLEAMAMGLPVVATSVGGLAEIIEHGVTGLLVPPGDPPALADAILSVLDSPELAARLGAGARAEVSLARLTAVYRSALA